MSKAVGIDFGTSNCRVAVVSPAGKAGLLQNRETEDLTPSAVCWYKNEILVGAFALDRQSSIPQDVIVGVKRFLGLTSADPAVQHVRTRYSYPFAASSEPPQVLLGGQPHSAVEIVSWILKKVKADAELRLNDAVERAVLTVPVFFTAAQRQALREAAQGAGLKVQAELDEPTAALIASGIESAGPHDPRTILVFDLGGASLQVSLLRLAGKSVSYLSAQSDPWLGGEDFDLRTVEFVARYVKKLHGVDPSSNAPFWAALGKSAERAKKEVSNVTQTDLLAGGLLKDKRGQPVHVEMPLTREQFEKLIEKDVSRAFQLLDTALAQAHCRPEEVRHVLLIGGSSRIPLIRRGVVSRFGEQKLVAAIEAQGAVACGTAILAARLRTRWQCPRGHVNPESESVCARCEKASRPAAVQRVTPAELAIRAPGDRFETVIPAGTPYPMAAPVVRSFLTPQPNLRKLRLPLYQRPVEKTGEGELQSVCILELPPQVPQNTPLDVSFQLDRDGILEVTASLRDGSGTHPVKVVVDRGGQRSHLERKLEQVRSRWHQQRAETRARFETLAQQATQAVEASDLAAAEAALRELEKLLQLLGAALPASTPDKENT